MATAYDHLVEILKEMDEVCIEAVRKMYIAAGISDGNRSDNNQYPENSNPNEATISNTSNTVKQQNQNVQQAHKNALKEVPQPFGDKTNNRVTRSTARKIASKEIPMNKIVIKREKVTEQIVNNHIDAENTEFSDLMIKKENIEMPPPTKLPPKRAQKRNPNVETQVKTETVDDYRKNKSKRVKSLRSIKKEKVTVSDDSDIEIHVDSISNVTILDSDEEAERVKSTKRKARSRTKKILQDEQTVRVTRSKTRLATKQQVTNNDVAKQITKECPAEKKTLSPKKTLQSAPTDDTFSGFEASASNSGQSTGNKAKQDAEVEDSNKLNETVVIENPKSLALNQTITINKPVLQININDIMTDDEDMVEESPPKDKVTKVKPMFNPYEQSPVRKRVEAFEKLGAKSKVPVPTQKNKIITSTPATAEKYQHCRSITAINLMAQKSKSAMKASQAEYLDKKQRHREADALKKKEALIQAQTEERRRKREEKQLKAQQARDALEKQKQELYEAAERSKQEKIKQVLAEKEEKQQKQKEEAARKRALALKKTEQKKQEEELPGKQNTPLYRMYKAPNLPTADCYDSDEGVTNGKHDMLRWQTEKELNKMSHLLQYVDHIKRAFFSTKAQTPNLREIFPLIEPSKLKRTSSAIWNTSDMSKLENIMEED